MKIEVVVVTRPRLSKQKVIFTRDDKELDEELHLFASEDEVGDRLVFTIEEMDKESFQKLPDFTGW